MKKKNEKKSLSFSSWDKSVRKPQLLQNPERRESFTTSSDFTVKPLYLPGDGVGQKEYPKKLGFPGCYPFTRGIHPTMYRGKLWTMRQYAGFGSAEESNSRYRYLLDQGQTGLSIAFDLPTQMGYDSDHPMAQAEVGKVGVAIDSLQDMEILFDQIPLEKVSTSMTINATATTLLALYIAVAEKRGISRRSLSGTIQNDILKEYIARGTYIYPPKPSLRLITDTFTFCKEEMPKWNTISISGYHIREAGATAVQEVAFTLGNAITYVEAALQRGLKIDDFAQRLSFFFNVHNNFFEEVAKFRAARRLWAHIVKNRFKAKDERSLQLRFHTQTAGSTLTAQQPENNVVRVSYQALAAVLGGTQSLHTNSRDEALALPTEESVQIALRTQQILGHETGVADTPDPMAGSYYVEALTDQIEKDAWALIEKILKRGGVIRSIEDGFIQRQIQESAFRNQQAVDAGDYVIVGLNKFFVSEEVKPHLHTADPQLARKQKERLARLRAERNHQEVSRTLSGLEKAAKGSENLLLHLIDAVKAYATVGEISDTLRKVFGVFQPATTI
ncbi:MAG TPA: methylmalonyl-CoA mutase family protein [Bdellovibrionota bacterium]|nr:methylmalonyl-CoA mutase family protein [Bdellovibrionota bacterium]